MTRLHRRESLARPGFTLVEMLVVIGVVVILISMLTVGLKMLSGSGGATATRTTMESLVAISNDLQQRQAPGGFASLGKSPFFGPGVCTVAPEDLVNEGPTQSWFPPANSPAVTNPGAERYTSSAVLVTAALLNQAQAIPDLNAILNGLPAAKVMPITIPVNGVAGGSTPTSTLNVTTWLQGWQYSPNADVVAYIVHDYLATHTNTLAWYQCTTTPTSPYNAPPNSASFGAGSQPANPSVTSRVVLDAWNNPMIYVPPGGLRGVIPSIAKPFNGGTTYQAGNVVTQADLNTNELIAYTYTNTVAGSGNAPPASPTPSNAFWSEFIIHSPDFRGFWASAGPDGNMTTGDDNVYSFSP